MFTNFFEITNKRNLADSYKIERNDFNQEIFSLAKLLSSKAIYSITRANLLFIENGANTRGTPIASVLPM